MKYQLEYYCGQTIRNVALEEVEHFVKCDGYDLSEEVEMDPFKPTFPQMPQIPCPNCGLYIKAGHMMWFRVDGVSLICKSRTISTSSSTMREAQGDLLYAWAALCMEVGRALGLDWLFDWTERKLRKLLGRDKDV